MTLSKTIAAAEKKTGAKAETNGLIFYYKYNGYTVSFAPTVVRKIIRMPIASILRIFGK